MNGMFTVVTRCAKFSAVALCILACPLSRGQVDESPVADVLLSQDSLATREFAFTDDDNAFLDEVERACFNYFWREVGTPAGLVRDRWTVETCSTAGVGFQLSAIPIGVARGWISHQEGERRATSILQSLVEANDNQKFGIYLHFVDANTGRLQADAPQVQASTVDHALLQSGAIVAGMFFGNEPRRLADELVENANWKAFMRAEDGLLSFGWRPEDPASLAGPGDFRPWVWHASGAEEALCYFHAVGAKNDQHAIDPAIAYRVKRKVGQHQDQMPYVVSWNGSMFTYFFDQCWIDYRRYHADNPAQFGIAGPRVHWFENSRRAFLTHRARCIEKSAEYATLAPNRWGLGPCMGLNDKLKPSYLVQDLRPNHSDLDLWRGGTVAPYVAGAAMPFLPAESLAALREMRQLEDPQGGPLVWRDPAAGGYGYLDSFNLNQAYVPDEYIAIDVGPMLLMLENARTGLIWDLFHQHPHVVRAAARLGWIPRK